MKVVAVRSPGGLDRLAVEERPEPAVGPRDIRVRLRASSLNFHDYAVADGKIRTPDGRIPMSDGAGEVLEVGEAATLFRVGDRVMSLFQPNWQAGPPDARALAGVPGDGADGFAAEQVSAPETAFTAVPAGYDFIEAATLPCAALTAWRALMVEARIRPGQTVLVQGSGGMSLFALQFAKAAGARVVATSSSDEKLERMRALGADLLINYKEHPDWGVRAFEQTGGGVHALLDVGGTGTLPQSLRAVAVGGHISLIGAFGGWNGEVPVVTATLKNVTMKGLTVGSRADQLGMVQAIETVGIRPVIDRCFPMEALADAFRYQLSQRHVGKIGLSIGAGG